MPDLLKYTDQVKNLATIYSKEESLEKKKDLCKVESKTLLPYQKGTGITIDSATGFLKFPTESRWLNGEEYAFLIRHFEAYAASNKKGMSVSKLGHPAHVYEQPFNGLVYFIRGWHLREFGFPRAGNVKKIFKWKKMNFTTDLPKNDPICTYLVSTGRIERESYRMHVVVNSQEYNKEYRNSDILKQLKQGVQRFERENPKFEPREKEKRKLLPQDRESNSERIILCHVRGIDEKKQALFQEKERDLTSVSQYIRPKRRVVKSKSKAKKKAIEYYEEEDEEESSEILSLHSSEDDDDHVSDTEEEKEEEDESCSGEGNMDTEANPLPLYSSKKSPSTGRVTDLELYCLGNRRVTRGQIQKIQKTHETSAIDLTMATPPKSSAPSSPTAQEPMAPDANEPGQAKDPEVIELEQAGDSQTSIQIIDPPLVAGDVKPPSEHQTLGVIQPKREMAFNDISRIPEEAGKSDDSLLGGCMASKVDEELGEDASSSLNPELDDKSKSPLSSRQAETEEQVEEHLEAEVLQGQHEEVVMESSEHADEPEQAEEASELCPSAEEQLAEVTILEGSSDESSPKRITPQFPNKEERDELPKEYPDPELKFSLPTLSKPPLGCDPEMEPVALLEQPEEQKTRQGASYNFFDIDAHRDGAQKKNFDDPFRSLNLAAKPAPLEKLDFHAVLAQAFMRQSFQPRQRSPVQKWITAPDFKFESRLPSPKAEVVDGSSWRRKELRIDPSSLGIRKAMPPLAFLSKESKFMLEQSGSSYFAMTLDRATEASSNESTACQKQDQIVPPQTSRSNRKARKKQAKESMLRKVAHECQDCLKSEMILGYPPYLYGMIPPTQPWWSSSVPVVRRDYWSSQHYMVRD